MAGARLSVGMISPWPPVRSGIADYSSELALELSRLCDVSRYSPEDADRALGARHDVLLFQLGNDPLHAPSVEALERNRRTVPAVVVLHDYVLHHLFAAAYLDRGRERDYVRQMARAHGERGRIFAEKSVSGPRIPIWDLDPWAFPMSEAVAGDATAVIVHSRTVRGALLRERPGTRVVEIPHHVVPAVRTGRLEARIALGLPPDRPIVVSLGVVTPAKRIQKVLDGLALLPPGRRPFLFVGGSAALDDPLRGKIEKLGLAADVSFGGYLSEEDFWRAASAADVGVNLRFPTMGETSGAVCRLAGFGLPVLVSDLGWFRELPESFASKIPIGSEEERTIAEELDLLTSNPSELAKRSAAAREWGRARSPMAVAERYAEVLEEAARGRSRAAALPTFVSAQLRSLGVGQASLAVRTPREPDAKVILSVARSAAGLFTTRGPGTGRRESG